MRIGAQLFDASVFHRAQAHGDDRHFARATKALRLIKLGDAGADRLHVEEHQIRFARRRRARHLRDQHVLHAVKRDEQKCAQADRQRHRRRLIVGTMQIRQPLAPGER